MKQGPPRKPSQRGPMLKPKAQPPVAPNPPTPIRPVSLWRRILKWLEP